MGAPNNKCVEVHGDSYVANEPAQRFYDRLGFAKHSMSCVLPLWSCLAWAVAD